MADEIDLANETADRWLAQSLQQMAANNTRLQPKGTCYYCDATLEGADAEKRLFCDIDCSQDYETEQRLKNRR